jgi:hypothetical protein
MIDPKKRNSIAELSYYVRDNEEHDFLVNPNKEHIFVQALVAQLMIEDELVITKDVALCLLLLSMEDFFDFNIVVDGIPVDCKSNVFKNLLSYDEYQDKSEWYKSFDKLQAFLNFNEKSIFKVACFKEVEPFVVLKKNEILLKLTQIQKLAELTGMEGRVKLEFTGVTIQQWDVIIHSITEYPRHEHLVTVSPKLTVVLLLG